MLCLRSGNPFQSLTPLWGLRHLAHGWVGVSDRNLLRPIPWGDSQWGKGPLISKWPVRTLAEKSESLGRETLFRINKNPLTQSPPVLTSPSVFPLYLDTFPPFLSVPSSSWPVAHSFCWCMWGQITQPSLPHFLSPAHHGPFFLLA